MNICIIQTAFLGDLILTASFIETLSNTYPGSSKYLIVKNGLEGSFSNKFKSEHKLTLLPYDKKKTQKSFLETIKFSKNLLKFDLLFCIHNSFRSGLLSFFTNSKVKIGFKQNPLSFLFNYSFRREGAHEIIKNHKLFSFNNSITIAPSLNKPYNLLPDELKNIYGEYLIVAPGSQWATKKFTKYIQIVEYILTRSKLNILLTGSCNDKPDIDFILNNFNSTRIIDLSSKTNLNTLCSLIANAKLIICNDSAPLHIAAGTKTPILCFFGPTSRSLGYYPLLKESYIFEINDLECRPCGTHGHMSCPLKGAPLHCMNLIDINEVYKKIDEFLELN